MRYVSFDQMITGFNTDVRHEGQIYHVQTEDRGRDNPILESLVYVGGTIVAKKLTSYSDQLSNNVAEDRIAALLKRQHQVVIAAIKAGRIDELIQHSRKHQIDGESRKKHSSARLHADGLRGAEKQVGLTDTTLPVGAGDVISTKSVISSRSGGLKPNPPARSKRQDTGGLNLDHVIADYMKRSSGQTRLDLKVLTPDAFTAGKNVGLRVQVTRGSNPEFDAIVTVKIIGTAFKPQVFIGRVAGDGVASFSLALPSFTTGTAAIVIEARSGSGHGELKNLIRKA